MIVKVNISTNAMEGFIQDLNYLEFQIFPILADIVHLNKYIAS